MFVGTVVAASVARRPRVGTRRLGTVAERAGLVDPREGAPARADRHHLDAREADRVAVLDEPLLRDALLAVVDERDVRRGAAHVETDRVPKAAERGEVAAGDRARGDARRREAYGESLRQLRRHHAAAGVKQQHVAAVAILSQPLPEPPHVAADQRREHCVRDGRREAFVLEDLGQDLRRGRDADARQLLLEDLAHSQLVRGIRVRVDETDCDGLDGALAEHPSDPPRLLLVERRDDLAGVVDPLCHLEAVAAADVRRRDVLVGVPEILLRAAADLDHVAEAARRHHRRRRQVARDERVRRDRRSV